MTREDGAFELAGIPEGDFLLLVQHPRFLRWTSPAFHISQDTILEAVELTEAGVLTVEIAGLPHAGARVFLEPLGTAGVDRSFTLERLSADRYLGTSLPEGDYILVVGQRGYHDFRWGPVRVALHHSDPLRIEYRPQKP